MVWGKKETTERIGCVYELREEGEEGTTRGRGYSKCECKAHKSKPKEGGRPGVDDEEGGAAISANRRMRCAMEGGVGLEHPVSAEGGLSREQILITMLLRDTILWTKPARVPA